MEESNDTNLNIDLSQISSSIVLSNDNDFVQHEMNKIKNIKKNNNMIIDNIKKSCILIEEIEKSLIEKINENINKLELIKKKYIETTDIFSKICMNVIK